MIRSILRLGTTLTFAITTLLSTAPVAEADHGQNARVWTINRSGNYRLYRNHTVNSGDAIVITASNVTLDLGENQVATNARGSGRGISVEGAKGVVIRGGRVSGFNANVTITDSENVKVEDVQIVGDGLAPNNGPSEIGILLVNSRACAVEHNTVSSVNLGIFVRGGKSAGNRFLKNIIVGGATAANNLLGICYNPAPGGSDASGPRGDSIYNNHIARFGYSVAVSAESRNNMFNDNTLASFIGAFREPQNFEAQGGTNVEFDNTATTLPNENL